MSGLVEEIAGRLTMRIPLETGGQQLVKCARGIGEIVGSELHVVIPPWLAEQLGIIAGTEVVVDNRDGKFNIYPEYGETN
ncbi:MAG TPA: hypothetical protein VGQ36_26510 [Thermoanaerobaculia bacterium]|nr:hypothetical protein [Thermoanaerobaculia bacterium]